MLWQADIVIPAKLEKAVRALAKRVSAAEAKVDRMANARTRGKRAKGEDTRALVLRLRDEGKSIAETHIETELSTSHIARIRGQAKRPK